MSNFRGFKRFLEKTSYYIASDKFLIAYGFVGTAAGASGFISGLEPVLFIIFCFPIVLFIILVVLRNPRLQRYILDQESLYYSRCEFDFKVNDAGDMRMCLVYTLCNSGEGSIDFLPGESWMWFETPASNSIQYRVLDNEPDTLYRFRSIGHTIESFVVRLVPKAYTLSFKYQIDPPLPPGGEITYEINIDTPASDKEAFSPAGSYWGFPAILRCEEVEMTYSAPPGFRFEILKPVIIWDKDRVNTQPEKERVSETPSLNASSTVMFWSLKDAGPDDRYWSGYRLVQGTYHG